MPKCTANNVTHCLAPNHPSPAAVCKTDDKHPSLVCCTHREKLSPKNLGTKCRASGNDFWESAYFHVIVGWNRKNSLIYFRLYQEATLEINQPPSGMINQTFLLRLMLSVQISVKPCMLHNNLNDDYFNPSKKITYQKRKEISLVQLVA